jgi:acetyl/propionyl-CoA carboxylase alpha subunit
LQFPQLAGVRIDSGVRQGDDVTPYYDPLLAKVIARGESRAQALSLLIEALEQTEVVLEGPKGPRATNREFLVEVLRSPAFSTGAYDTHLLATLRGQK